MRRCMQSGEYAYLLEKVLGAPVTSMPIIVCLVLSETHTEGVRTVAGEAQKKFSKYYSKHPLLAVLYGQESQISPPYEII